MTKVTKKEIRHTVEEALKQSLSNYDTMSTPKKTKKIIKKFAKKVAKAIKGTLMNKKKVKGKKAKTSSPIFVS